MKKILALMTVFLASAWSAHATIIDFNFTGANPGQNGPWNTGTLIDPNVTTPGFSLGGGTVGNSSTDRFNARDWSTGSTLGSAITGSDFFGFVLTPNSGYAVNLNSATVSFQLQVSATGPKNYALMSSIGGFTSGQELQTAAITGLTPVLTYTFGSSGFDNITGSIEFRIYGYNATGNTGTMSANDFSLTGSVSAVPEPAEWGAISCLGLLVLFGIQHWRQHRKSVAAR